ncbi:DinB family protein [Desulfovibrio sp. OttesenSCG-928-F20]|nr:DinB family protein [Desulfovibrio sp. OttesenSCG-928-F20]
MSRTITQSLEGGITHAFALSEEFLRVCPENIRDKKFGGWPVWQQLFHPFASIDFFLRPAGAPEAASPFAPGVAELKQSPEQAPAKLVLEEYISACQALVKEYVASLDDAALAQKNEGLSQRIGRDMTHAATLALIASHTMYHLGCCDAALREHGLPGVF